jgi:septal ring factor EnvC (AmiA/AmiB activator)
MDARLAALDRTDALLSRSVTERRAILAARVRSFYKASRSEPVRLWMDAGERIAAAHRGAAAWRILGRDVAELALFRLEQNKTAQAREQLTSDRGRTLAIPLERSLFRPIVSGQITGAFGEYIDRASRARLVRQGIDVATRAGRNVRAVDRGTVRYVGELRGVGVAIVIAHAGGYMSVLGRVAKVSVTIGQTVERGQAVAEAIGDRIYLEIRAVAGSSSTPIDPTPLFE